MHIRNHDHPDANLKHTNGNPNRQFHSRSYRHFHVDAYRGGNDNRNDNPNAHLVTHR
jgi:hypothetical protein